MVLLIFPLIAQSFVLADQGSYGLEEIFGGWSLDVHAFLSGWMGKGHFPGVEHLAFGSITGLFSETCVLAFAIGGIAYQRIADMAEVDADLISSSVIKCLAVNLFVATGTLTGCVALLILML